MILEEAIKHCLEVAENNEQLADGKWIGAEGEANRQDCIQCAKDHRQLAEWLTKLKEATRLLALAIEDIEQTDCCFLCKYHHRNDDICKGSDDCFVWRYADEALKLIGDVDNETN